MSQFVRVKHEVFGEYTVHESAVDPKIHTVLDKPAVDQNGDVIPGKPKTSVAKKAAENNGDEPAAESTRSSK